MPWDCNAYYSFLADRLGHWETDILNDWFPVDDAWMGQVATLPWAAFTGTQHIRDRMHMGAPDLSQGWNVFDTQSMLTNYGIGEATADGGCVAGACAPAEICVGWGLTRNTFDRFRTSYTTRPFCFDEINTRAKAKEQVANIVAGLKDISKMVQADFLRSSALTFAEKIYMAGSDLLEVDITGSTFGGGTAAATIDIGGAGNLPTSELTVQYLQRFTDPLQFEGYFKYKTVPNGVFKLITDIITSQQLLQGNPTLQSMYKFTDFTQGGDLFKYGISKAVGNFGISWDSFPLRYYWDGALLRRVWPYVNISAGDPGGPTIGIKKVVNTQYTLAPYQISQIWHPEAMKRYVPSLESVSPEMPFLTRDLAGKWSFFGGNKDKVLVVRDPVSGDTCTIDNKRGNQGLMFADFEGGIEFQRPELVRGILHLREPGCVTNQTPCSTPPAYVIQDYSGCLPLCQEV